MGEVGGRRTNNERIKQYLEKARLVKRFDSLHLPLSFFLAYFTSSFRFGNHLPTGLEDSHPT